MSSTDSVTQGPAPTISERLASFAQAPWAQAVSRVFWTEEGWRWRWAVVGIWILPLWIFRYVPATDLPNHLAISRVIYRLLSGETMAHYELNITSNPYYLVYLVLVPLVALVGPAWAATISLTGLMLAFFEGAYRLFRLLGLPPLAFVAGAIFAYNGTFFWGFAVAYGGTVMVVWATVALLAWEQKRTNKRLAFALLTSAGVPLAHVGMMSGWAIMLGAFWLVRPKERFVRTFIVGLASLVPLIPWMLGIGGTETGEGGFGAHYSDVIRIGQQLNSQLKLLGHGLAHASMTGTVVALGVIAFLGAREEGFRPWADRRRFGLWAIVLGLLTFVAIPAVIVVRGEPLWGLHFRVFIFAELGLIALFARQLTDARRVIASGVLVLTASAYVISLYSLWFSFDSNTRKFEELLEMMPPDKTLSVVSNNDRFKKMWAPVQMHTHAYYVARDGGYDDSVFAGHHIPIRVKASAPASLNNPEKDLHVGDFDYMLIQMSTQFPEDIAPVDGRLIKQVDKWRLYERDPNLPAPPEPSETPQ